MVWYRFVLSPWLEGTTAGVCQVVTGFWCCSEGLAPSNQLRISGNEWLHRRPKVKASVTMKVTPGDRSRPAAVAQFSELWLWPWMCMGELWELLTTYRNPGWMRDLSLCLIVNFFFFFEEGRRVPSYNAFQILIWKCFKQGTSEAEIQSNLLKLKVGLHENELLVCEKSQVWKDRMVSLNEFDSLNKYGEAERRIWKGQDWACDSRWGSGKTWKELRGNALGFFVLLFFCFFNLETIYLFWWRWS